MTTTNDSTMVASEAAGSLFKEVVCSKKSKRLKTTPVQKTLVQRTNNYMIQVYFPMLRMHLKFNLSTSMCLFFTEMLKYNSTNMVANAQNDQQIQLVTDVVPINKEEF